MTVLLEAVPHLCSIVRAQVQHNQLETASEFGCTLPAAL
jgi:hypothetical protein